VVFRGKLCASMCILIFLQGHGRRAARANLWIFHEARPVADKRRQANRHGGEWRLFRKYYLPAGVSMNWLKRIALMIKEALWQTGGDLISAKTGIIMYMYALSDRTERVVAAQTASRDKSGSMSQRLNVLIAERP
jgi:hypothetical protein